MAADYGYVKQKARLKEKLDEDYGPALMRSRAYGGPEFFGLPHQCDEWFIGDEEDVLALIEDLKELIGA